MIDWQSTESHVFSNPKLPTILRDRLKIVNFPKLPGHIWLASSGTSSDGAVVLYGLSKGAFLIAADAANIHLQATEKDIWLVVLPNHHVGGLSIFARAKISGSQVFDRSRETWSAEDFHAWCENDGITLTSLVPTQLFDLVELGTRAPEKLRAIVVGGAALDEDLYRKARKLSFNCLPSFGMTECCSQVATAPLSSLQSEVYPELQALPHVELQVDEEGRLGVKSAALFSMRLELRNDRFEQLWRVGDWYITKDRVEVRAEGEVAWLKPLGRSDEEVKISGELVDLAALNMLFRKISGMHESLILAQPEARRGSEIVVVLPREAYMAAEKWSKQFNDQVLPVARIAAMYFVNNIPRTELGKVRTAELRSELGLR